MRKTITALLAIGVVLWVSACGSTKEPVGVPTVNQVAYDECWAKHWSTYEKNIADGFIERSDATGRLDRMCRAVAQK